MTLIKSIKTAIELKTDEINREEKYLEENEYHSDNVLQDMAHTDNILRDIAHRTINYNKGFIDACGEIIKMIEE